MAEDLRRSTRSTRGVAPVRFQSTPKRQPRTMSVDRPTYSASNSEDEQGAGEDLDLTIVSADMPTSEEEGAVGGARTKVGAPSVDVMQPVDCVQPINVNRAMPSDTTQPSQVEAELLADLRLRIEALQVESAQYKLASVNYKTQLASIRMAAEIHARRPTSIASTQSIADFAGFSEPSSPTQDAPVATTSPVLTSQPSAATTMAAAHSQSHVADAHGSTTQPPVPTRIANIRPATSVSIGQPGLQYGPHGGHPVAEHGRQIGDAMGPNSTAVMQSDQFGAYKQCQPRSEPPCLSTATSANDFADVPCTSTSSSTRFDPAAQVIGHIQPVAVTQSIPHAVSIASVPVTRVCPPRAPMRANPAAQPAQPAAFAAHGATPAAYGAPLANYGAPPAAYGAPPAEYGAPPAVYGAPPASYNAPPAEYGAPPVTYGAQPAAYGTAPAAYAVPPAASAVPRTAFAGHGATPAAPPASYAAAPAVTAGLRTAFVAHPAAYSALPATYGAPPAAYGPPPAAYGAPPAAYGAPPAVYGAPPAAYGAPPAAYGVPPAAYGAPPAAYGTSPAAYAAQPAAYGAPPAAYGVPPAAYGAPPAAYGASPAAYAAQPAAYGAPSAAYGAPPAVYGAPPATYAAQPAAYAAPPVAPAAYGQPMQTQWGASGLAYPSMPADAQQQHELYAQYAPDAAARPQPYMQRPSAPSVDVRGYVQPVPMAARAYRPMHDLPSFGGRAEEWPLFICAYVTTTQQFGYTDVENMLRLQKCLTGSARKRVESILIRPEHVGRAVDALAKAFGRPETLVESQIIKARQLPTIAEHQLERMVDFSISVDGLVTFLDSAATQHHLSNPTLLNEIESKLPMSERLKWAAVARGVQPYPTLRDFATWLDQSASLIASITSYASGTGSAAQPRQARAKQTSAKQTENFVLLNVAAEASNKKTNKCTFCAEAHDIRGCAAFLRLSVPSRLLEIKRSPICYGCLREGHLLPGCGEKKKCGKNGCDRWHDPLLHEDGDEPATKTQPKKVNRRRGGGQGHSSSQGANAAAEEPRSQPTAQALHVGMTVATSPLPDDAVANDSAPIARPALLSCQAAQPARLLLFRVVPVKLYGPERTVTTYALLDEGSSVSLLDAALADELGLEGVERALDLQFVNAQGVIQTSREVGLGISGVHSDAQRFEIGSVYATSSLALPIQTVNRSAIVGNNVHLTDVPFAEYRGARPRLLIGLEHHHLGIPQQVRTSALGDGIVAALTKLGWVLFGSDGRSTLPSAIVLHVRRPDDDDAERWDQLNELVQQHFTTENFGVKTPTAVIESDGLRRARRTLECTTRRVGQRFETGLLWARDEVELPDSRAMALQRLVGVEARMRRDGEYARQYRAQIQAYVDKGYARKATPDEAAQRGGRSWFLPHFAVQNVNKPGKFRLVFDAAARAAGVSLNSELLAGPDANVPLTRLLFRFRLGAVGVCADVREMFHQVRIRQEDQMAQRFLWRDGDATVPPEVFVMNVMTFGSTCSPASAQFVKNVNASEFAGDYPEAADAICRNHYVDDYVASFRSPADATRITAEVIDLQRRGGFDLRGVISNCVAVQRHFGAAEANQIVDLEPEGVVQKILGMTWETSDDTFRFQTRFGRVRPGIMDGEQRPTKRDVLSVTMSIFDPFGLLADFLLASKIILQELWRADVGWDEQIPEVLNTRWQVWRTLVEQTRLVRIPRCYSPSILSAPGLQLHVYADASEEAFAAVAYWRIQGRDGVEIAFVAGKVRCAPLKMLSIPRMELQAAMLAARLTIEIRESHAEIVVDRTVLWSDSETVLKWLRCDQRRYKVFVAVRVAEIVENAPANLWRWVPSALNPADDATRVRTPLTFDPNSRWLHGPAWLAEDEENWPSKPATGDSGEVGDDEEVRARFVGAVARPGAVDYDRFSKLYRLIRTVAWTRRFASNARERSEQRVIGELSATEVNRATDATCRLVQQEAFGKELASLRAGKTLPTDSSIFVLKPYLADDGLLRVHGRTDAADVRFITDDAKRPILMPHAHRVTMLLVRYHHEQFAHQLADATIAAVRAKFWVPQLRTLVNQVRRGCQVCKMRAATPTPTSQGQLPRDRMDAYARPFTNTGLDFFGPVQVTVGRRREKRWVALFTCLTVRAVHLEVAADLSTDACLLCIRNLCNLRGVPSLIRCDNGTNFVGAQNELAREQTFFDAEAIQREMSVKGVEWRFNCPGNPEAGGAWERLVQAVKKVLRTTLHEEAPRPETLRSLLIEAANIVNARPLTHLQVTPEDPDPITPNHFLMGGPNVATVPNPADAEPTATRKQWQICRGLSRRFWVQFIRDYLPELTRRGRHHPEQPPLRVGDLVIICDEQQPRSRWVRGRIVEAVAAPDGAVRTATVQTASGTCRRPATKLARLDVCASDGGDGQGAECRQLGNGNAGGE